MSLEQFKLVNIFTTATANDTEISTFCSNCHSTPDFYTSSEISRRHSASHLRKSARRFRHSNTMLLHKFLLIYALVFLAFSPIILCMRQQGLPNGSVLSQITPATNSIDHKAILSDRSDSSSGNDDYDEDESDEDHNEYKLSPDEIREHYEKQLKAYAKDKDLPTKKDESKNALVTTLKPTRSMTTESSCSSNVCKTRQNIEQASTESIRKHILLKLGMEHEPNKTNYPKLTAEFRERLCKKINISPENCLGTKLPNVEYQSDDPTDMHFDDDYNDGDRDVISNDEDVQYLSFENRIYAFPSTTVKPRHKSHLVFQFTESQETNNVVSQALLNIFVHSKKYLRSSDLQLPKNLRFIDIEIAKVLQGSQHKMIFETFHNISVPDGGNDGDFVQLNITQMVAEWFSSHETSHGMAVKIIASKTGATLPHKIVSLDAGNFSTRPFIDILPRDQRKKRTKRSTLQCAKGSNESRCCRHELTVDFEKFGWEWVIAPKKYDANYCSGECKIAFMQKYPHTHVVQLSAAANPCCSPRKMTHMQLLYFDAQLNIVLGTIPNMIVEECFCS